MSDGSSHAIEADNAADAIQSALEEHRGLTVDACCRGDSTAGVSYDVPPHKALPIHPEKRKRAKKEPSLFDLSTK